jgi:ribosome-binding protein aMBF1 (putative translation factor)
MSEPQTFRVGKEEFVILPRADYLKLRQQAGVPKGAVDAHEFMRTALATTLRKAREHAKLTQADLAERMGKSQTMVSQAESGAARVSERYVRAVLEACGLPEDWKPSVRRAAKKK